MKRFSGLNVDTAKKIMLDVGAFFVNAEVSKGYAANVSAGKRIGATQGGGTFAANPETHYIQVDGMPENTKGMLVLDGWKPTLELKMLEQDADNVKRALGAAKSATETLDEQSYTKVSPKEEFEDSDYLQNVAYAGKIKGSNFPVWIILHNAVSFGGLSWSFADKSETTSDVTFNGHYSVGEGDEISAPPFEIYIPDDITTAQAQAAIDKAVVK